MAAGRPADRPSSKPAASNRKVLVLAGDGIGPEIMREVLRIIEFLDRRRQGPR